uniref:Uncharacterized protein n=1 Tax=Rhizophora mucronata TaxID=61149 RepID=A0A2P2QDM8_RHIMU
MSPNQTVVHINWLVAQQD